MQFARLQYITAVIKSVKPARRQNARLTHNYYTQTFRQTHVTMTFILGLAVSILMHYRYTGKKWRVLCNSLVARWLTGRASD